MKIKILRGDRGKWYHNTDNIGKEFDIIVYSVTQFKIIEGYWVNKDDCVITELPESFCVKRCDDRDKWDKYIQWLNKNYGSDFGGGIGNIHNPYYGLNNFGGWYQNHPFGTEIHIDDMIKHIDFYSEPMVIESKEEFDMTTPEAILAYAKRNYPVGTKYKSIVSGQELIVCDYDGHLNGQPENIWLVYYNGKWAELIKEEKKMETQKLSRQGLKEIHSVACTRWKEVLEHYGTRNPLEDYIELTQEEVNNMFKSCTKEQLPIVSKYLKQDDGSVDVTKFTLSGKGFCDDNFYIIRDREWGEYKKQSFLLSERYDWEIKTDDVGQLCLIPTKKK